jgi:hypothetical protein
VHGSPFGLQMRCEHRRRAQVHLKKILSQQNYVRNTHCA